MTVLETKGLENECSYLSKERPSKMKSYDIALFHIISECGHAYLDMEWILYLSLAVIEIHPADNFGGNKPREKF